MNGPNGLGNRIIAFDSFEDALKDQRGHLHRTGDSRSPQPVSASHSSLLVRLQEKTAWIWKILSQFFSLSSTEDYWLGLQTKSDGSTSLVLVNAHENNCWQRLLKRFDSGVLRDIDLDITSIARHLSTRWEELSPALATDEVLREQLAKIATRSLSKGDSTLWNRSHFLLTDREYVSTIQWSPFLESICDERFRVIRTFPIDEWEALFDLWNSLQRHSFIRRNDAQKVLTSLRPIPHRDRERTLRIALDKFDASPSRITQGELNDCILKVHRSLDRIAGDPRLFEEFFTQLTTTRNFSLPQRLALFECFLSLLECPSPEERGNLLSNFDSFLRYSRHIESFLQMSPGQQRLILNHPARFFKNDSGIAHLLQVVPTLPHEKYGGLMNEVLSFMSRDSHPSHALNALVALKAVSAERNQALIVTLKKHGSHFNDYELPEVITLLSFLPSRLDLDLFVEKGLSTFSSSMDSIGYRRVESPGVRALNRLRSFLFLFPEKRHAQILREMTPVARLLVEGNRDQALRNAFYQENDFEKRADMAAFLFLLDGPVESSDSGTIWANLLTQVVETGANRGEIEEAVTHFTTAPSSFNTFLSIVRCVLLKKNLPSSEQERFAPLLARAMANCGSNAGRLERVCTFYLEFPVEEREWIADCLAKFPADRCVTAYHEEIMELLRRLRAHKVAQRKGERVVREEISQKIEGLVALNARCEYHFEKILEAFLQVIVPLPFPESESLFKASEVIRGGWSGDLIASLLNRLLEIEKGERDDCLVHLLRFIEDSQDNSAIGQEIGYMLGYLGSLSRERRAFAARLFYLFREIRYAPHRPDGRTLPKDRFPVRDIRDAMEMIPVGREENIAEILEQLQQSASSPKTKKSVYHLFLCLSRSPGLAILSQIPLPAWSLFLEILSSVPLALRERLVEDFLLIQPLNSPPIPRLGEYLQAIRIRYTPSIIEEYLVEQGVEVVGTYRKELYFFERLLEKSKFQEALNRILPSAEQTETQADLRQFALRLFDALPPQILGSNAEKLDRLSLFSAVALEEGRAALQKIVLHCSEEGKAKLRGQIARLVSAVPALAPSFTHFAGETARRLSPLYRDAVSSDITLKIGEESFPLHRFILRADPDRFFEELLKSRSEIISPENVDSQEALIRIKALYAVPLKVEEWNHPLSLTIALRHISFASLLETGQDADCTLVVEGVEFRAHRKLLAAYSDVFRVAFSRTFKEGQTGIYSIQEMSKETFAQVLAYFYSGEKSSLEHVEWFQQALNRLLVN